MIRGQAANLIAVLAGLAVVVGLALVGGPDHARMQRRDAQREQDLLALAGVVDCVAQRRGSLPEGTAPIEGCDWNARQTDPHSNAPYRFVAVGPDSYRLCANFELPPQRPLDRWGRDAEGCISREFRPATPR